MIEQRSAEWFEQRKSMITGSRVGGILGLSPFSKPEDVMRSMVREYHGAESEFTGNIATNYGNDNEDAAIFALEQELGIEVIETGFHKANYWLGASPDGLVGDTHVVEVKCPYGKRNATSSDEFKSIDEQPHYYAQMQIEMFCTNSIACHFYQWAEGASKYEIVEVSQYWLDDNFPKLADFHSNYLKVIASEDLSAPYLEDETLDMSLDSVWLSVESDYMAALAELDAAKSKVDKYTEELLTLGNGRKCASTGLTVFKVSRQGSISYAKAIKELKIDADFEAYRGKASESWTIKAK